MQNTIIIIMILVFSSCENNKIHNISEVKTPEEYVEYLESTCKSCDYTRRFLLDWEEEAVSIYSAKINNKISIQVNSREKLFEHLGKPDTIFQSVPLFSNSHFYNLAYRNETSNFLQYGNSFFEEDKSGRIVLHSIDFRTTDIEITTSKIIFSKKLNVNEVRKKFPLSYEMVVKRNHMWNGTIIINTNHENKHKWVLHFLKNKLIGLDLATY